MIAETYRCPGCRGRLENGNGRISCVSCSRVFGKNGSIPVFLDRDMYYGEIPREKMNALLRRAEADGYRKAAEEFLADPFVLTYVLDEGRARWADLLPIGPGTRVLDVGCGWGTNTIPIARRAGHVAAVDITGERVGFVEIRARQCGLANISLAAASAVALPYPDASFDVVVFNGVLEWLGGIDAARDPAELQLRALREARRVLAPGGLVYVGIENRFSLRYFLGTPDDHSHIRFTSLMPRRLARAYFRLRTGGDYYMYTHSLSAYRRMLADAGFERRKEFHPWPNYRNPVEFTALDKEEISGLLQREIRRLPAVSRKGTYCSLLKWLTAIEGEGRFCHSFLFVYAKAGEPEGVSSGG